MSELVNGRASCHKTLLQIYIRKSSALCAASHLPGEGSTDVEDSHAPAC